MLTPAETRRALRAFKQRGIVVHVGALNELYNAYQTASSGSFSDFLDKAFVHIFGPDGASDGILTKTLAASIASRLQRHDSRAAGEVTATLDVIDAFSVPRWYPTDNAANRASPGAPSPPLPSPVITAPPLAKADIFRTRYHLMLSKTLRNDRFRPAQSAVRAVSSRKAFFELSPVESLDSKSGDTLVLGMLTQLEEGSWFLEDINGSVRLDLSQASVTAGLHTDGSFVIAQGVLIDHNDDAGPIFQVCAMGTPPIESRELSMDVLGKDANLFGGHFDISQNDHLLRIEKESTESEFLFLSDVALDSPRVMAGLRHLFSGYSLKDSSAPTIFIFMGNFLSHPFGQDVNDVQLLQDGFAQLGNMIKNDFEALAKASTFVFIPSTNDVGPGNVLPRPPLPKMITRHLTDIIGNDNVHFATNPCRIRYMTQEIVFLRDNIMQKMVRHCSIKPDFAESGLMCEHLIKTVVDQAYLCPLPLTSRPVLWAHHHALWLFPTPHVIVMADRVDGFICKYGDGLGLNPGSFGTDFSFQLYLPAERRAQQCSLDNDDVDGGVDLDNSDDVLENRSSIPEQLGSSWEDEGTEDVGETAQNISIGEGEDDGSIEVDNGDHSMDDADSPSSGKRGFENGITHGGSEHEGGSGEESDDDSYLVPAEGVKKIDIAALLKSSVIADTSSFRHDDDDSENDDDRGQDDDTETPIDSSEPQLVEKDANDRLKGDTDTPSQSSE